MSILITVWLVSAVCAVILTAKKGQDMSLVFAVGLLFGGIPALLWAWALHDCTKDGPASPVAARNRITEIAGES